MGPALRQSSAFCGRCGRRMGGALAGHGVSGPALSALPMPARAARRVGQRGARPLAIPRLPP